MRRLKEEQINQMDTELLLEELKYVNTVTLHNDRLTTYLIVTFIAIIMSINKYYKGDNEIFLWIKSNMEISSGISVIFFFLIGSFLSTYFNKYKDYFIMSL